MFLNWYQNVPNMSKHDPKQTQLFPKHSRQIPNTSQQIPKHSQTELKHILKTTNNLRYIQFIYVVGPYDVYI